MRGRLALAALAALATGTGAHAAPVTYDGNFTSRDCAFGGGFLYCDTAEPNVAGGGFAPRGMRYVQPSPKAGGSPAGSPAAGPSRAGGAGSVAADPGPGGNADGPVVITHGGFGTPPGVVETTTPPDDGGVPSAAPPGGGSSGGAPTMTSVPEPGALTLFGVALAALGITRRRMRGG